MLFLCFISTVDIGNITQSFFDISNNSSILFSVLTQQKIIWNFPGSKKMFEYYLNENEYYIISKECHFITKGVKLIKFDISWDHELTNISFTSFSKYIDVWKKCLTKQMMTQEQCNNLIDFENLTKYQSKNTGPYNSN